MESSQPVEVTRLLARARAGDAHAMGAAYSAVYDELKRAARLQLRRMHDDFQTTALVHEAYLKLGGAQLAAQDRNHLLALSARDAPNWCALFLALIRFPAGKSRSKIKLSP